MEWDFGRPIEFFVDQLRVADDVACGALPAQRSSSCAIDLFSIPGYRRGMSPGCMDGAHVAVLYRKLRETWVAMRYSIGATDVWFAAPNYCIEYAAVIPEWCK